jgi:hypothetical protein
MMSNLANAQKYEQSKPADIIADLTDKVAELERYLVIERTEIKRLRKLINIPGEVADHVKWLQDQMAYMVMQDFALKRQKLSKQSSPDVE